MVFSVVGIHRRGIAHQDARHPWNAENIVLPMVFEGFWFNVTSTGLPFPAAIAKSVGFTMVFHRFWASALASADVVENACQT